jgi:hypothetical protein
MSRDTWKSRVYARGENRDNIKRHMALSRAFKKEFGYQCQACRKQRPSGLLGLHHIIPRNEGGTDDPENLILLCFECHNKIEERPEHYKTRTSIAYSFCDREPKEVKLKPVKIGEKWQEWVYGSRKNPLKSRVKTS